MQYEECGEKALSDVDNQGFMELVDRENTLQLPERRRLRPQRLDNYILLLNLSRLYFYKL